jgi:hypothetical protein
MIRKYTTEDLVTINTWYAGRGMEVLTSDVLPKQGLIVPGVAALFHG